MRILSVDDKEENRYFLETLLRGNGHDVVSAANGVEAVQKLENQAFDVIVSDILMPQKDGFQLCREVKTSPLWRHIPFIFYTATYTDAKDEELGLSLGAARFILKPQEPDRFIALLNEVLLSPAVHPSTPPDLSLPGEEDFLKTYNHRLIHKLERKIEQLEASARNLERSLAEREREAREKKLAEESLRESEAFLHDTQTVARIGGWKVNPHTGRLVFTPGFAQILEAPSSMRPGWIEFLRMVAPAYAPTLRAAVLRAFDHGEPFVLEAPLTTVAGKHRWTEIHGLQRAGDGSHAHVLGTIQDITERKRLEEELRQVQKMETFGAVAGGVAHDFNNVLSVISMSAEYLLSLSDLTPEHRESAQQIAGAAQRAASLTRQLLTFSRKQPLKRQNLDLNGVVADFSKLLLRILRADIALECHPSSAPATVCADLGMLEQILMNLAVNARDAMPNGGRLDIRLATVRVDANTEPSSPRARAGDFVCLSIQDTGCGIAPENMARIFEPFYTTKESGKGTGLGLAIVYAIVKQHQGWLEVESALGRGTVFKVFLPAATAAESASGPAPSHPLRGGSEGILVVEDDAALRSTLGHCLRKYGYAAVEAADGMEALELWAENRERIQLLVSDLMLPAGLSGRDLAERLQKEKPTLKILFISGYGVGLPAEPSAASGTYYLPKPFTPGMLVQIVREALDARPV